MRFYLLLVALFMLNSCNIFKPVGVNTTTTSDTVYIETIVEVLRDTTIFVELPPVTIEKYVYITDTLTLTGKYSYSKAWVNGNMIHGKLQEGTAPVKIKYQYKDIIERVYIEVDNSEKKEIVRNRIPNYIYFIIFVLLLVIVILIKFHN